MAAKGLAPKHSNRFLKLSVALVTVNRIDVSHAKSRSGFVSDDNDLS